MCAMNEGEEKSLVPKEAPPGLFFTKAAFLKYSALSRVKDARAARKHGQPCLPKPLGPLPGSLARPGQAGSKHRAVPQSKDEAPAATQDAVVSDGLPLDEAASEELASEDIWGSDDGVEDIMEDESAAQPAKSMEPEQATPAQGNTKKPPAKSGTRKRKVPAPAKEKSAPKRQRRQLKRAQDGEKDMAVPKQALKVTPLKRRKAEEIKQSARRSQAPDTQPPEVSEPREGSEAPSELEATKAQFLRTMGLPAPRAFSSGPKGAANCPAQREEQIHPQQTREQNPTVGQSQPGTGMALLRQTQAQAQQGLEQAELGPVLLKDAPDGVHHKQKQRFEQAHAAAPPARAKVSREPPSDAAGSLSVSAVPEAHASEAEITAEPLSDAGEQPPSVLELSRAAATDAAMQHEAIETKVSPTAGKDSAAGLNQSQACAAVSEADEPEQPGSSSVPAGPGAPAQDRADPAESLAAGQLDNSALPTGPGTPRLTQPLAASGRPVENGVKLFNLLNPNNSQYDQAFALEYARIKAAATKDGGKGHKRRGPKRIYSNITAQDQAWYLAKQGVSLRGRDAERMADLSEKVAKEQQQFIRAQWQDAQDVERFRCMDPRIEAQLQAHLQPRREAVRQLPQLWQLQGQLQLAAALQGPKQAPAMAHLSTPISFGQPQAFAAPGGHTAVDLDRSYMAAGGSNSAPQGLHQDKTALQLAAEKRAAVIMADGAFAEVAQTAVQGFAAGWEIPVTVLPASTDASSQQANRSGVVVMEEPLLKRALSRREKHELLFAAAILKMGHDKSLKQQLVQTGEWRKQVLHELESSAAAGRPQDAQGPALPGTGTRPSEQPALRYSLWRLGEHRIVTKAQVHAALQSSVAAVVQAKMEYHGNKAADAEEVTAEELVRWWSAAHVRPGAHVLVGHVGVHSCQVLRTQHYTASELLNSAAGAGFQSAVTWRLLSAVLARLTSLPPGGYLLTHQPSAEAICLFAATSEDKLASDADVAPLPCMTYAPQGTIFDLWSAHAHSGATDESQLGFIPKMWQPSFPDMPQIPYTFTPRQPQAKAGNRRGRKGNVTNAGPGAGQIMDWDTRPKNAGSSDPNFSAAMYAELISEDI